MERQRRCRKGKGMMSILIMAGWGIIVHMREERKKGRIVKSKGGVWKVMGWWQVEIREEKGRKDGTERQRSSRKGKGMISGLMMAEGWKRVESKKGWDGKAGKE
jgi:hypothetical protein